MSDHKEPLPLPDQSSLEHYITEMSQAQFEAFQLCFGKEYAGHLLMPDGRMEMIRNEDFFLER